MAIAGIERRSPALKEDEHDEDDQDHRLDQRLHHFLDRQLDEVGRVIGECVAESGGIILCQLLDPALHQVGGLQRVGAWSEEHRDARARMAVHPAVHIVVFRA